MATLELVLFLAISVLASSVISQFLPKIPTSLVQILMGLAIALLATDAITVSLDPELFLVLFIAPLLYDEARTASLGDLWHYRGAILTYAIGLVLAIVLIVGFSLNALVPSIPLAAAFALGAALGPTDAVAVSAVSKQTNISKRNHAILKGESLLNDASGLVSFQFAVAAVVTGGFSLKDAGIQFVVMFFGGILVGVIFGLVINFVIDKVRDTGLQDTTFHVLLELCIPFIVYLVSEHLGVSGIIAVVVCGVVNVVTPRTNGVSLSRTSIVSSSVWKVLTFVLNGIVFVMLGTQLPGAMFSTWESYALSPGWLIAMVLAITLVLEAVRFFFSLGVEIASNRRHGKKKFTKQNLLSALTLTLSGAKGTITLSIMFSIPLLVTSEVGSRTPFPYRDLLIFLACGVILTTLLLATFVVPLISPKVKQEESEQQRHERDVEAFVEILRTVIEELTDRQTKETARATGSVVSAYNDRIGRIKDMHDLDEDEASNALQLRCIGWEKEYLVEQMYMELIDAEVGYELLARLERREELLRHSGVWGSIKGYASRFISYLKRALYRMQHKLPFVEPSQHAMDVRAVQLKMHDRVIERLQSEMADMDESAEEVANAILTYQRLRNQLQMTMPSFTAITKTAVKADEIELLALRLELRFINEAAEDGRMSKAYAKLARENVYLMQIDLEDRI